MKEMYSLALAGFYVGGGVFSWFVDCSDLLFGVQAIFMTVLFYFASGCEVFLIYHLRRLKEEFYF